MSVIKTPLTMNYSGNIWIGKIDSDIRLWLDQVRDDDSYQTISQAAERFFMDNVKSIFRIDLISTIVNPTTIIDGKLIKTRPLNPMDARARIVGDFEFTPDDPLTTTEDFMLHELNNQGYFYLTGEIEGHDEKGKAYDSNRRVFVDITKHVVDSVKFTELHFYYERSVGKNNQHLLPPPCTNVPF